MDGGKDDPDHRAGDRDLGQLEGDGAGVAHDEGPDVGQLELQARPRLVGHGLGQFEAAQEGCQIVGDRVQLQSPLVVSKQFPRQPLASEAILAFLDVLLGGAALVVAPDDPVRRIVRTLQQARP